MIPKTRRRRRHRERPLHMHMAKRLADACPNTMWFHVPNGELREKAVAATLRQMGVRPGVADFIILSHGRAIAAEVKDEESGRQSEDQKGFQRVWEANGGVYEIVKSAFDVDSIIFRYGLN